MKFNRGSGDGFRRWRATIPWTDEEIASAFEELAQTVPPGGPNRHLETAEWVRRGHLSTKALLCVLPVLVKTCAICGKKALYMQGMEGRCSSHRLVPSRHTLAVRRRIDAKFLEHEAERKDKDRKDLGRAALHKAKRFGRPL